MELLNGFRHWVRLLCISVGVVGAVAVVFMMVLVTSDVVGRGALRRPVLGAYELVEYAMILGVCAAFGVAQTRRSHIRVDVLVAHLPPRTRALVDVLNGVLVLAFIGAIGWMGYSQMLTMQTRGLISPLLHIPRWPFELWLVLGWSLFFLAVLADFLVSVGVALGKGGETGPIAEPSAISHQRSASSE